MSGTELRDVFDQMITAAPAPPFTAAHYVRAGEDAGRRRRYRRMATGGVVLAGVALAASFTVPSVIAQRDGQQAASTVAAAPQIHLDAGAYYTRGVGEQSNGNEYVVPSTVKWHASAPGRICSMRGAVFTGDGTKLATFEDKAEPFRRMLQYSDIARGASGEAKPPSYATVTVTDCRGRTSSDSINLAVVRAEETAAVFTPGWTTQRCTCWSGGSVRRSSSQGAAATFSASFNAVAVLTNTGPKGGTAEVYVDGVYARSINLASSSGVNRVIGFQTHFVNYGPHTIRIRVVRGMVDIDSFVTSDSPAGWGR